jgi:HD-GYP domain-containing protein (c-di-GMP phosphodiesterase class II)
MGNGMKSVYLDREVVKLIDFLVFLLESRMENSQGHSLRVAIYSRMLGKKLNLPEEDLVILHLCSVLHDIGKSLLDPDLFKKGHRLEEDDFEKLKQHVSGLAEYLGKLKGFKPIKEAILQHHERYDGLGYPAGIKGEDISIIARIISIVDAFDSICNVNMLERKDEDLFEVAKKELIIGKELQFDPFLVDMFIDLLNTGSVKKVNDEIGEKLKTENPVLVMMELDEKYCNGN